MKKSALGFIFLLAFSIRAAYIWIVPPRSMALDDSYQWNLHATHYLHGGSFLVEPQNSDLIRPPLYPLFLALNYHLFGETNYRAAKISQAALDSLSCVLLCGIGFLLFNRAVGFWSGLATAFYPPLIVYTEILQSEIVFTFLVVLFIFTVVILRQSKIMPIVSGFVLGLSNLCRGTLLYFPFLMMIGPLLLKKIRAHLWSYLMIAIVSIAVLAPWSWRNFQVYHRFIAIRPRSSELLWFGTMPLEVEKQYGFAKEFKDLNIPADLQEQEKFFKDLAIQNIERDPQGYAILTVKKFFYFWIKPVGHEILSQRSALLSRLYLLFHLLLLILFANGIIFTKMRWEALLPLYLLIGYFSLLHSLLMPMPRFRLPVEPFVILFAVAGVEGFCSKKGWISGGEPVKVY